MDYVVAARSAKVSGLRKDKAGTRTSNTINRLQSTSSPHNPECSVSDIMQWLNDGKRSEMYSGGQVQRPHFDI